MLTIKIDVEKETKDEIADYLEHVANKIEKGFTAGEGWDLTGDEENEDDDVDEEE